MNAIRESGLFDAVFRSIAQVGAVPVLVHPGFPHLTPRSLFSS